MKKCSHRVYKVFTLAFLAFFIVTACQSKDYFPKLNVTAVNCRIIKHQLGESCIPYQPQRIVLIDQDSLEAVVALGLKPIAATQANALGGKAALFVGKIDDIVYLGKESQPNIEKMVQLRPDLILGYEIGAENYSLFSQIAPTVSLELSQTEWKKSLQKIGEIVNRTQTAQQILNQYHQRIEQLRKTIQKKQPNLKVSISRFYSGSDITQFQTQQSFPGVVLEDVGLSIPPLQHKIAQTESSLDKSYVLVSKERLELLDGDVMFVALDPNAEENFNKYRHTVLWQQLNVVRNNQVYTVDSGYWIFGNILAANAILDDLSKYLINDPKN
jgi:iron complex transport system substrate-binding protein